MSNRINPYTRLLKTCKEWANKIKYRHTVNMWRYPKDNLSSGWDLKDLWERTKAAEQLGYDVILVAKDDGLSVNYVKKIPECPWELS